MYQIIANGKPILIGDNIPIPIMSLEVHHSARPRILVSKADVPHIEAWLLSLIQHLDCDYVTVNGALVPTKDLPVKDI
jgi:hypothetical protein